MVYEEVVMDEWQFEQAEKLSEAERESAIADIHKANEPQTHPDFDGIRCVVCLEKIHPVRVMLGKVRCTECQELYEKKHG